LGRPEGIFKNTYLFHCHNMQHEDSRMMSQLKVLPRQA
jgi:FtsP/CotA-like multicopper oxidase with cupredoxin domain